MFWTVKSRWLQLSSFQGKISMFFPVYYAMINYLHTFQEVFPYQNTRKPVHMDNELFKYICNSTLKNKL